MNKLVIFGIAALAVLGAAMLATPPAAAINDVCFIYYTEDEGDAFDLAPESGYAVDASYYGCSSSLIQCFNEGYSLLAFDTSYMLNC